MWKKTILFALILGSLAALGRPAAEMTEHGTLSIFFREEKVGYEEYIWTEKADGFLLQVTGRMTAPLALEVESLSLCLSRDFIPCGFSFKGSVNGIDQEVDSMIVEGVVTNRIKVAGQDMKSSLIIRRDAFLLPNPLFSPYQVITRKYRCASSPPAEVGIYIIPQLEVVGQLTSKTDATCQLVLTMSGVEVTLTSDEQGRLTSLIIPAQHLRVVADPSS
jgi:hypothetical protein